MAHDLVFGSLSLVNPTGGASFRLFALSSEEETDWGEAEATVTIAESFLEDGALESVDRFENREVTVGIEARGDDGEALAAAEAALMAECGRRNELVWTPPSGASAVFEVLTSWLTFRLVDGPTGELSRVRRYVLTLRCRPFVRSESWMLSVGPFDGSGSTPVAPVETNLRTAAQGLTGWTGSFAVRGGSNVIEIAHAVTVGSPVVRNGVSARADWLHSLTYTSPSVMNLSGQLFLMVEWFCSGDDSNFRGALVCHITGTDGQVFNLPVAAQNASALGGTNTWFALTSGGAPIPSGFLSSVKSIRVERRYNGPMARFAISKLSGWNRWPFEAGTAGSQQAITLDVQGTARTEASLQIGHQTTALGEVLAWTGPQLGGYWPNLTQYRVSGGTVTADSARLTGSYRALTGALETCDVPLQNLPQGTYSIYALVRGNAAGGQTLSWSASTRLGSTNLATETGSRFVDLTTGFVVYEIGRVVLPTVAAQTDATVRMTLGSSGAAFVDEWWLFNLSDGALSHVKCGTGTPAAGGPSSRLWLDTPSLNDPKPSQWLGTQADKSDARHGNGITEVMMPGTHTFPPGPVSCFVVSTTAGNVAVSLDYYPRWHTHPQTVPTVAIERAIGATANVERRWPSAPTQQWVPSGVSSLLVTPSQAEVLVKFTPQPMPGFAVTAATLHLTVGAVGGTGQVDAYHSGNDWTETVIETLPTGEWNTVPAVGALAGSATIANGAAAIPLTGVVAGQVLSLRLRKPSGSSAGFRHRDSEAGRPVLALTYTYVGF